MIRLKMQTSFIRGFEQRGRGDVEEGRGRSTLPGSLRTQIISHRGVCKTNPRGERVGENTIEAFEEAIHLLADLGYAKAIELDLHVSKDRIPVVIHDATVNRTTNGFGPVREKTIQELQELDAGYGRTIPSLVQVLDHFKYDKEVLFHIELKESGIADELISVVVEHKLQHRVIVSSFDQDDARYFFERISYRSSWQELKLLRNVLPVALSSTGGKIRRLGVAEYIRQAKDIGAFAIHPRVTGVSEHLVKEAHAAGLLVNSWTVNDHATFERCEALGVDGVFCDNPAFLVDQALPTKVA